MDTILVTQNSGRNPTKTYDIITALNGCVSGVVEKIASARYPALPKTSKKAIGSTATSDVMLYEVVVTLGKCETRVKNLIAAGRHMTEKGRQELGAIDSRLTGLASRHPKLSVNINWVRTYIQQGLANSENVLPATCKDAFASPRTKRLSLEQYAIGEHEKKVVEYVNSLLNYIHGVTSTRGNSRIEKISVGDGSFRQDALAPLLNALISLISKGKIDVRRFSWSDVVEYFDIEMKKPYGKTLWKVASNRKIIQGFAENMKLLVPMIQDAAGMVDISCVVLSQRISEFVEKNLFQ